MIQIRTIKLIIEYIFVVQIYSYHINTHTCGTHDHYAKHHVWII
jgi:hypothetical protein